MLGASVTACFMALSACSANRYVQRGADLYGEGRYVEADEVFERSGPRVARAPLEQRAAYAAYRGATFVALGDLPHAQHWLTLASQMERTRPGTLRSDERAFLDGAWRALANRSPQLAPPPASSAVASTNQAPTPGVDAATPTAPVQRRALVPQ